MIIFPVLTVLILFARLQLQLNLSKEKRGRLLELVVKVTLVLQELVHFRT